MIAQIIFFIAIAVFLVLISRRLTIFSNIRSVGFKNINWSRAIHDVYDRLATMVPKSHKRAILRPNQDEEAHEFWKEESIEDKPELPSYFEEADSLFKNGKYKEAEKLFLKAASQRPKDSMIYARLGLLYLQQKCYTDAIESLKLAVKLDKNNPSRHFNLALAYQGAKDNQRAIAEAREATSLDPVTPKYREFLEQLLGK